MLLTTTEKNLDVPASRKFATLFKLHDYYFQQPKGSDRLGVMLDVLRSYRKEDQQLVKVTQSIRSFYFGFDSLEDAKSLTDWLVRRHPEELTKNVFAREAERLSNYQYEVKVRNVLAVQEEILKIFENCYQKESALIAA